MLLLNKGATPKAITFRKLFPKQLREGDESIHAQEINVRITIVLCHCKRIRSLKICIAQKFTKKYAEKINVIQQLGDSETNYSFRNLSL